MFRPAEIAQVIEYDVVLIGEGIIGQGWNDMFEPEVEWCGGWRVVTAQC